MATTYTPHVQVGFDLRTVKHYGTPEACTKQVTKAMQSWINEGVAFNILIVAQRRGGAEVGAEDLRYIPLLNCFRGGPHSSAFQARVFAANHGFNVFA